MQRQRTTRPTMITPEQVAARDHARRDFARVLRLHGVPSIPHFDEPGEEKVLYVNVAFATALRERNTVVGLLEQQGWAPDPDRLSRLSFAIETLRLRHPSTGARMTLVLRIPTGDTFKPDREAA